MKIVSLIGSLRAASTNRTLAGVAASMLPGEAEVIEVDIDSLPHYSEEYDEGSVPAAATAFRDQIRAADAVLVVTPEYNGSMSSVIKNAIDWASRPREDAAIHGKPAAVIGASASPHAAQRAREAAVHSLSVAGAKPLADTVGVGSSYQAFGEEGELVDPVTREQLRALLGQLADAVVPV